LQSSRIPDRDLTTQFCGGGTVLLIREDKAMQNRFSTFVLASAMTATAAFIPVPALAVAPASTLHVPFSFSVDGVILPAGDYEVDRDSTGNVIYMKGEHGGRTFSWISRTAPVAGQRVILHFEARRESYALQSIQYGAMITPPLVLNATRIEDVSAAIKAGR